MTRIPKLLKIWLVSVIGVEILIWTFAFAAMRFDRRVELAKHWEVAVGTIVAVNPQQHLSITADYFVGGRQIQNTFQGSGKIVGDQIAIYYCPEDPNNADTENPASGLHRETWLLVLGGVLLGTFGALTIQFRAVPEGRSWFSVSPRMVMIITTLGVTIETINLLLARTPNPREWIAIGSSLIGTAILDRHALHLDPRVSLAKFVRSWSAAVGIPLLLAGILIALT